jgi:hypothetical protein
VSKYYEMAVATHLENRYTKQQLRAYGIHTNSWDIECVCNHVAFSNSLIKERNTISKNARMRTDAKVQGKTNILAHTNKVSYTKPLPKLPRYRVFCFLLYR